ncbi:MAG: hypothetical protein FJY85_22820, partial [Deltaproteobacteria bacterium]|nr:hypothetical protein [Deltaproteobacteria bacterium]
MKQPLAYCRVFVMFLTGVYLGPICLWSLVHADDVRRSIRQEDLTNIQVLLKRYHDADQRDEREARMFLGSLDPLKASRNWGIVFKSCGSAAMRKPSVRALLGVAL